MSTQAVTGTVGPVESDATVPELLEILGDVVAMVSGRVTAVDAGFGAVSVHVSCQEDAEYLARRLWLGFVDEYQPQGARQGFVVWSNGDGPRPIFRVFYSGELVRPVQAFPLPFAVDDAEIRIEAA